MKQYIGISRDHSGSMRNLRRAAMQDYNNTIDTIKRASIANDIDTIVSVVRHEGHVVREVINSGADRLKPLTSYGSPGGSTPLFDSVADLISILESAPDAHNANVSFLVIAVTDGYDNSSNITSYELSRRMTKLMQTDRWTFVFRVPVGNRQHLVNLGIPSGNIQEWEQTERGMNESSVITAHAMNNYYAGVARGVRSTTGFFANMTGVTQKDV